MNSSALSKHPTFTASPVCLALVVCLALLLHGCAQTEHDHAISPAFRPPSEKATEFIRSLEHATVAVYPSIIRTLEGTAYSESSQQRIVSLLNQQGVTRAVAKAGNIDLKKLQGKSQWEMFKNDLHAIAGYLQQADSDTQYSIVMEFLLTPGDRRIFGIHCYVFDRQGDNAFSFLLNAHHKIFVDAGLKGSASSESSRAQLIEQASRAGVTAMIQQVHAPQQRDSGEGQGYSITSQKLAAFDQNVARIFVVTRLAAPLIPVFRHSFEHSLISGLESNGIETAFEYLRRDSSDLSEFEGAIDHFSPAAVMYVDIDPLYRERKDGRPALAGTAFEVRVIDRASDDIAWRASGKVDYIQERFLNRVNYRAHEGIRKEFAWHTTAAIVRTFTLDMNGRESAPIYTVTEDRDRYRQRTD